jgi:protein phosphatase
MLEAVGLSHQGLVRGNNEDQFYVSSEHGLGVLADGMGGAQAGETASLVAVQAVIDVATSDVPSPSLLDASFLEADLRVRALAEEKAELRGMGTTLVAMLETSAGLAVSSVGDSRGWLWEDGGLTLLTSDNSWVNEIGRNLGLSEEALSTHPLRHALTTAIGVGVEHRVQSQVIDPRPGSMVLLSSDGLHGVVPPGEIAAVFADGGTLDSIAQTLIDLALEAGGPDNVTVVIARF